jgi:two-component system chemotaxis response regulator CheB
MTTATRQDGWRVLLVDDSIVVRAAVRAMLAKIPKVARVETARSANAALDILDAQTRIAPIDVILLDVEMPSMSGIEALPHLLKASPTSRVVMASSLTRQGAAVTMAALAGGASDYLCKPCAATGDALRNFEHELAIKVTAWAAHARRGRPSEADRRTAAEQPMPASAATQATPSVSPAGLHRATTLSPPAQWLETSVTRQLRPFKALAIGSSTGGPQALVQLFGSLGAPPSCPVFVTQHMPPAFTAMLAEQLSRLTGGACREAADGEPAAMGRIFVAPGDRHLLVKAEPGQRPVLALSDAAPENFCRPAVDPMLRSLALAYREMLCTVILTGMGQDGRDGCRTVKEQGGQVIVQDEASSVVWGMPGSVAKSGLADHVLPIPAIAALLRPHLNRSCLGAA